MRFPTIDLLRTFAIFLMVLVHFSENLSGYLWAFAGFGAPHFALLTGASYRIWVSSQERKGKPDEAISKVTIRRGLFLFALGFAFNIAIWLPEDVFNWDILTLVGTSLLILNWVRRVPASVSLFACLLIFLLSPVLRILAGYPEYWQNGYFDPDMTIGDVLTGFLVTGYFPLFPWIVYPIVGYAIATVVFDEPDVNKRPTTALATTGFALAIVALICLYARSYLPESISQNVLKGWTMFPPSIEYMLATIGVGLMTISLGHRFIDLNPKIATNEALLRFSSTFSKHSLSIYLLHHVVHIWPLWAYGCLYGSEPTEYWRVAMPATVSVPLAILFLVLCYFFFRWVDRTERQGVEGWMRWLCD